MRTTTSRLDRPPSDARMASPPASHTPPARIVRTATPRATGRSPRLAQANPAAPARIMPAGASQVAGSAPRPTQRAVSFGAANAATAAAISAARSSMSQNWSRNTFRRTALGHPQELHRPPIDDVVAPPVEQVDDGRDRHRDQPVEQDAVQERHNISECRDARRSVRLALCRASRHSAITACDVVELNKSPTRDRPARRCASGGSRSAGRRPASCSSLQNARKFARYSLRSRRGSTSSLWPATSRLRNCVHFLNGNSISSGARMWNSSTSCRRWRKCCSARSSGPHLVEAVRQDDDQAAPLELRRQLVPERGQGRLAAGLRLLQRAAALRSRCLELAFGGMMLADLRVVRRQADGVALVQHQVGQRGGDVLGVLELAGRACPA